MNREENIIVYADWLELNGPILMGLLQVQRLRGKEIFSFEYDSSWLNSNFSMLLDPNLGFFSGKQFLPDGKINFGIFLDSSPDRWGRLLMRRREALKAKSEDRKETTLQESDYLLGVYDGHRMGGLRFKLNHDGDFLNNQKSLSTPPWASLRDLEYASLQLEKEDAIEDPNYKRWISMLVDPGSSLGGARPKASIIDDKGQLWIAKFPSAKDEKNVGLWELLVHHLAEMSGIIVPEAKALSFSKDFHTYLSRRFDRTKKGKRIHFASAMNLLGHTDGADSDLGVSYLEIAAFIMQNSADARLDLEQLWRRIVFNILVSNTDDHLRNHGFILTDRGWRLSPAFDMNPNELGHGLKLNINENSNELDLSLALEVSKYFKLSAKKANQILEQITSVVSTWRLVAKKVGLSRTEIELMSNAFLVNH